MDARLTPKQKEKLAYEILEMLEKDDFQGDTYIYYDNKRLNCNDRVVENDMKPTDYFDYANDKTLSMSFEGILYELIDLGGETAMELDALFGKYGLYYEQGDSWNLSTYYLDDALAILDNVGVIELKDGDDRKHPQYIFSHNECPAMLDLIRKEWGARENAYGDKGSCVLGAGFVFVYKDKWYKMTPQGHCQGSLSWEHCIKDIEFMLKETGCTEIHYDWGRMD